MEHTIEELRTRQAYPLELKISLTETRIRAWVNEFGENGVYVSFSGGKDSTVLLDIVRNRMGYKDIPAVFVDVPTQFPELKQFAKTWENVEIIRPKISFMDVCNEYGFPLISKEVSQCLFDVNTQAKRQNCDKRETSMWKRTFNPDSDYSKKYPSFTKARYDFLNDAPFACSHRCCDVMKKKPAKEYEKKTGRKPIMATMAEESRLRTTQWLTDGCNAFNVKRPTSKPLSFWTEQDILTYIHTYNVPLCSVYGEIVEDYKSEGLIENQLTFDDFAKDKRYKTTGYKRTGCMLCGFGCQTSDDTRFLQLKETHPKMYKLLDIVKNNGVTFREAIEWTNEHGNLNIKL